MSSHPSSFAQNANTQKDPFLWCRSHWQVHVSYVSFRSGHPIKSFAALNWWRYFVINTGINLPSFHPEDKNETNSDSLYGPHADCHIRQVLSKLSGQKEIYHICTEGINRRCQEEKKYLENTAVDFRDGEMAQKERSKSVLKKTPIPWSGKGYMLCGEGQRIGRSITSRYIAKNKMIRKMKKICDSKEILHRCAQYQLGASIERL